LDIKKDFQNIKNRDYNLIDKKEINELTRKSRRHDEEAFGRLYSIMGKAIYYFLMRFTTNTEEFRDIIQETFLVVLEKPENEISYDDCFNYILTISKYKLFATNKKYQRVKFDSELVDLSTVGYDIDKMNLKYLIDKLDYPTISLMYMLFYSRIKLKKIALLYDTSVSTIKRRRSDLITFFKERF